MANFEVGDVVRVKENIEAPGNYTVYINPTMLDYRGECLTIAEVLDTNYLGISRYKVEENDWTWSDDILKEAKENETMENTRIELPETLMIKDVEPYVPTEEEMKYLIDAGTELLDKYDYDPRENGLKAVYEEWATTNAWMIELFKKSPNYVDGKFYIKLPATKLERPVDKEGIRTFIRWAKSEISKIYIKKELKIGMFTVSEYEHAKNRLWEKYFRMDNVDSLGCKCTIDGMTKEAIYEEYGRMVDRLSKINYDFYYANDGGRYVLRSEDVREAEAIERVFNQLISLEDYQNLTESDAFLINNYLDKTSLKSKASKGMKTTKFYGKVLRELGIDKVVDIQTKVWYVGEERHERTQDMGYNYHRALLGDSVNPYFYNRDVIISINPIDFWGMSLGYKWASCMTIDKENRRRNDNNYSGAYSGGTESLMLDNTAIVMYVLPDEEQLESIGEGNETRDEFKSKLKRCLFFLGEDKLIQSRVYPDGRDGGDDGLAAQLRAIMQKLIADLLDTPNMWTLKKGTSACRHVIDHNGHHYADYFNYDDCNVSYLRRIDGLLNEKPITIGTYDIICPHCGHIHDTENSISCCYDTAYAHCDRCGDAIGEYDDYIYIDGEYYCCEECAYNAGYRWCVDAEEYRYYEDVYVDDYDGENYAWDDDAVETEEGNWYANSDNCELDGNVFCEDIDNWSNDYVETADGSYYHYDEDLIYIDGEYYATEDDAREAGFIENEYGEWVPEVA